MIPYITPLLCMAFQILRQRNNWNRSSDIYERSYSRECFCNSWWK